MNFLYTDVIPYILSIWVMFDALTISLLAIIAFVLVLFIYFMIRIIKCNYAEEGGEE